MMLAAIMLALGAYSAFCFRRSYRDPDNWHIDPYSKELQFHNWVEASFCGVLAVLFALTGMLLLVL